ncbi:MAG: biotin transporter BioY, partial [Candidatus Marinimicrobia bacterium]|nr:biotin transporter BioY [Candidatus Neomarinimicrobiota bacterium]
MTHATYADILRPDTRRIARLYDVSLIVSGSLAVGLSAQVALPLAFSPVPITG